MSYSPSLCLNCKHDIELQSIAIQTESTDLNDSCFISTHSPGSRFRYSPPINLSKLSPLNGDLDSSFEDYSNDSSSSYYKQLSDDSFLYDSFIEEEVVSDSITQKIIFEG